MRGHDSTDGAFDEFFQFMVHNREGTPLVELHNMMRWDETAGTYAGLLKYTIGGRTVRMDGISEGVALDFAVGFKTVTVDGMTTRKRARAPNPDLNIQVSLLEFFNGGNTIGALKKEHPGVYAVLNRRNRNMLHYLKDQGYLLHAAKGTGRYTTTEAGLQYLRDH
jgi:hypothetical protein